MQTDPTTDITATETSAAVVSPAEGYAGPIKEAAPVRRKHWLASGFITLYLSILMFGLASHTFGFLNNAHPAMYFIVWDMFCGWSPYNNKHHIIAQGESGAWYDLAPAPWGSIRPWGAWERHHYDPWNSHMQRMGAVTLKYTEHETMVKMYVVEEIWAKKYDLPDAIWNRRYDEAKDSYSYFRVRGEYSPEGDLIARYVPWAHYQQLVGVSKNPRLYAESQKTRSMFVVDGQRAGQDVFVNGDGAGAISNYGGPGYSGPGPNPGDSRIANPLGN